MLSNRVAAKRAYHRRVEKMESLQKENRFLVQVLAERQSRQQKLEALVRGCCRLPVSADLAFG